MHTPKHHYKALRLSQFAYHGVLQVYLEDALMHCAYCDERHNTALVALEYDRSYDQSLGWHGFRPQARSPTGIT